MGERMKETKDIILEAALDVFSEKGYTSATTLEISKKAKVSEMTLFRHFQTKNNLFLVSIKQAMGESLIEDVELDVSMELSDFILHLLHEKMSLVSTHIKLVKMLIRESLSNTLPEDLEFTKLISKQVIKKISRYVQHHHLQVDSLLFAQMVVGLLLRYAIMESSPMYHLWSKAEQTKYLKSYLNILNI